MSEHTETYLESRDADESVGIAARGPMNGLPRIALLYADDALLTHVDEALSAMSAPIVYRAPLASADRAALTDAQPEIALINLDDRSCDERLDEVAAWLDSAGVPVVFNDAEISRALEGWARARWARHLAAKLRGSADVDPPRPASVARTQPSGLPMVNQMVEADETGREEIPAENPSIAARPLTPGEIESLVADFPAEATIASEDTEALSAHVDALLAGAAPAAHDSAPWEAIAPVEAHPAPAAAANDSAPQAVAKKAPGLSDWKLVDDVEPVVSAPRKRKPETAPAVTLADFDFELEPIEHIAPVIVRERASEELRIEEAKAKPAGRKQ